MKSYYLDEISTSDLDKITGYLNEHAVESGMDGLFWIEMPSDHLTELQSGHSECKPHRFAIEIGDTWIRAEFFIRTTVKFRCDCNGYCSDNQKKFIMNYVDDMIDKLDVLTNNLTNVDTTGYKKDKLVSHHDYWDMVHFLKALGFM